MKRLLLAVVCVVLLSALSAGVVMGHVIEEGMYNFYGPDVDGDGEDDIWAEVKERVYSPSQTFDLTGFEDAYLYSYTVMNDQFNNPGIWCWGFCENPSSWGANVLGWTGPTGWFPGAANPGASYPTWVQAGKNWTLVPWDCGCNPGSGTEAGWTGTALPNPGAGPNEIQDWIPKGDSLDTFWLVATNPPKKMVEAFVHDGSPVGSCTSSNTYVYGMISAPTPEPITMALLALGLPLGALAVRRRKED